MSDDLLEHADCVSKAQDGGLNQLVGELAATIRKQQAEIERLELKLAETTTRLIHAEARAIVAKCKRRHG
jgi:phage shock protein A